jgi:hypothetical protein
MPGRGQRVIIGDGGHSEGGDLPGGIAEVEGVRFWNDVIDGLDGIGPVLGR